MKKSNSYLGKILLGIFVFLILFPILTMIVWVFTERWAWPNLLPQVFSTRALDEVFGRKEELIQLFASSIFISAVVGVLSVMIGTMTARALVLYDFAGKGFFYFLSMLPFLVPSTVFDGNPSILHTLGTEQYRYRSRRSTYDLFASVCSTSDD
jgi:putative spermidine/putrescine transport system permease protein